MDDTRHEKETDARSDIKAEESITVFAPASMTAEPISKKIGSESLNITGSSTYGASNGNSSSDSSILRLQPLASKHKSDRLLNTSELPRTFRLSTGRIISITTLDIAHALCQLKYKYPNDKVELVFTDNEPRFKCHDCTVQLFEVSWLNRLTANIGAHLAGAHHANERLHRIREKDPSSSRWTWFLEENQPPKPQDSSIADAHNSRGALSERITNPGPSTASGTSIDPSRAHAATKRPYPGIESFDSSVKRTRLTQHDSGPVYQPRKIHSEESSDDESQSDEELSGNRGQPRYEYGQMLDDHGAASKHQEEATESIDNGTTDARVKKLETERDIQQRTIAKLYKKLHKQREIAATQQEVLEYLVKEDTKHSEMMDSNRQALVTANQKFSTSQDNHNTQMQRLNGRIQHLRQSCEAVAGQHSTDLEDIRKRLQILEDRDLGGEDDIQGRASRLREQINGVEPDNEVDDRESDQYRRTYTDSQVRDDHSRPDLDDMVDSNGDSSDSISSLSDDSYAPSKSPSPSLKPQHSPKQQNDMQNNTSGLEDSNAPSKVIIHPSCVEGVVPSWHKAKAKIQAIERDFPNDLPYTIMYENKLLELICRECSDFHVLLEGTSIGNVTNHVTSVGHGIRVKKRLESKGLEETSTSKVEIRTQKIRRIQQQHRPSKQELTRVRPIELSDENSDLEVGPRRSKRRRIAPADGLQDVIKNLDEGLRDSPAFYTGKGYRTTIQSPVPVPEDITTEIFQKFKDIDERFEQGMKDQKKMSMNIAVELNGCINSSNGRLEYLERNLREQKNLATHSSALYSSSTKICHDENLKLRAEIYKEAKAARLHMETTLQKHKEDNETFKKNISDCQNTTVQRLSSCLDRIVSLEKTLVSKPVSKRLVDLEKSAEGFQSWLEEMSTLAAERTEQQEKDHGELLEKQACQSRASSNLFDKLEKCTQGFHKKLADSVSQFEKEKLWLRQKHEEACAREINVSEAFVGQVVSLENHAAEFQKKLEDMDGLLAQNQSEQGKSSQAIINKITGLGNKIKGFEKKLGDVAIVVENWQPQQSKEDAEAIQNHEQE
ncbi:hypothetical protein SBOR_0469 [Sclerotinia borealis F-4128]|uniref:Uncharacterized protein n=1 Tax=Sclerotinia borealis (strain F-4128) TaxID=1432307 RepID=W9CSP2_SCLBF|nr:hypothetical protein SBOR_0469 [Sclerotinia borealis F-4128]